MKKLIKAAAAFSVALAVSGAAAGAAEKSRDVNCNGKADFFDLNTVSKSVLEADDYYDVFDVIRLKNDVFNSENPNPSSKKRTSVKYSVSENGLVSERFRNTVNIPMGEKGKWSVFVYMCGSDLESTDGEGIRDLKEMIEASKTDNVKFIVETGGANKWHGFDIKASRKQRFVISSGEINQVTETEQADMGESCTLADFLKWGVHEYPAENMGIIFWNHGGGSVTGACYDENYTDAGGSPDTLLLREIDAALLNVSEYMSDTFVFAGFDACLMSNLETACVMSSYADYMYASEELEPLFGWNYTEFVSYLEEHPDASGEELGKVIAESYYDACVEDGYDDLVTFSVTDLGKTDAVASAFEKFAADISRVSEDRGVLFRLVRELGKTEYFGSNSSWEGYSNMVDIAGLVNSAEKYSSAGSEVISALEDAVSVNFTGSDHRNACGLSVYYPLNCNGAAELRTISSVFPGISYTNMIYNLVTAGGSVYVPQINELAGYGGEFSYIFSEKTGSYEYNNPDSSNFGKTDDVMEPGNVLKFENEGTLEADNTYLCKISEETFDRFRNVYANLYLVSDDRSDLISLGAATRGMKVSDDGEISLKFDGKWFSLPDRQILSAYYESSGDGCDIFTSPVIVNGRETNLRIIYNYETGTAYISGIYSGLDNSGVPGRIGKLSTGDVIVPVYDSISLEDGSYDEPYLGDEYFYDGNDELIFDILYDGLYGMAYTIYDVFGDYYYGGSIYFEIADEKMEWIFTE